MKSSEIPPPPGDPSRRLGDFLVLFCPRMTPRGNNPPGGPVSLDLRSLPLPHRDCDSQPSCARASPASVRNRCTPPASNTRSRPETRRALQPRRDPILGATLLLLPNPVRLVR